MEITAAFKRKVCFFDSGIGGLSLLHRCAYVLPETEFYYFADNFNVPYGNRPKDEILQSTEKIFSRIAQLNPDAAVIACNTVTAQCAGLLRAKHKFPIIGIQPAVKEAVKIKGECAVFATEITAKSSSLLQLIEKYGNNSVKVVACSNLAAIIEKNILNIDEEKLLKLLPDLNIKSAVLGCTHYIFVKQIFEKKYSCPVFTGVEGTIRRILQVLGVNNTENTLPDINKITFIGGDANKNKLILSYLFSQSVDGSGVAGGGISQKIPKNF